MQEGASPSFFTRIGPIFRKLFFPRLNGWQFDQISRNFSISAILKKSLYFAGFIFTIGQHLEPTSAIINLLAKFPL